MKFKLEIDCSNDAFLDDTAGETARILRVASECVGMHFSNMVLRDINGNVVGTCGFTTDETSQVGEVTLPMLKAGLLSVAKAIGPRCVQDMNVAMSSSRGAS